MHCINFVLGNPVGDLPYFEHDQYEDSRIAYDEDRCVELSTLGPCKETTATDFLPDL